VCVCERERESERAKRGKKEINRLGDAGRDLERQRERKRESVCV